MSFVASVCPSFLQSSIQIIAKYCVAFAFHSGFFCPMRLSLFASLCIHFIANSLVQFAMIWIGLRLREGRAANINDKDTGIICLNKHLVSSHPCWRIYLSVVWVWCCFQFQRTGFESGQCLEYDFWSMAFYSMPWGIISKQFYSCIKHLSRFWTTTIRYSSHVHPIPDCQSSLEIFALQAQEDGNGVTSTSALV